MPDCTDPPPNVRRAALRIIATRVWPAAVLLLLFVAVWWVSR